MTGGTYNPQIDERLLLAYVEGELTADQRRGLLAAMEADPAQRERLEAMRRDRAGLRAIPDEPVPAGLLAAVADALEREAILAENPSPAPETPARSQPTRHRRPMSLWVGPLAAAAAVALIGGVALLQLLEGRVDGAGGEVELPELAMSDPEAASDPVAGEMLALRGEASVADEGEARAAAAPGEVEARLARAEATEPAWVAEPVDAERAAELAREGRLVMRVRVTRTQEMLRWLARVDAGSSRVALRRPDEGLVQSVHAWRRDLEVRRGEPQPPIFASRAFEPLDVSDLAPETDEELRPGLLLLEMEASRRAIDSAARAMERQDGVLQVLLEPLETPIHPPAPGPASSAAHEGGGVLWWRQSPEEWTPRVTVPILIEPAR